MLGMASTAINLVHQEIFHNGGKNANVLVQWNLAAYFSFDVTMQKLKC